MAEIQHCTRSPGQCNLLWEQEVGDLKVEMKRYNTIIIIYRQFDHLPRKLYI